MVDLYFKIGTYEKYKALEAKDSNTLYFITDTLQIFKGEDEFSKSVKIVTSLPLIGIQGIIYANISNYILYVWNGTDFVNITKGYTSTIDANANHEFVPTTKAVKNYVDGKISEVINMDGQFVTDVAYNDGKIELQKGKNVSNIPISGVAHNPTYDASTRTIHLPVFGNDELVISLGKDLVVTSGLYNEINKSLELTLTSGDKVIIPVGSLIDIYTGIATSTTTTHVSAENKISVSVKVSANVNNQIIIENDGLYVPLPDAYTKAQIDGKLKAIEDTIVSDNKSTNETIERTLSDAKKYSDVLNSDMNSRMVAVESCVTWKTL